MKRKWTARRNVLQLPLACPQAEVPPQSAPTRWPSTGVTLPSWDGAFFRYAHVADQLASEAGRSPPSYLHHAIQDLTAPPDEGGLRRLLHALLLHLEGGGTIYVSPQAYPCLMPPYPTLHHALPP